MVFSFCLLIVFLCSPLTFIVILSSFTIGTSAFYNCSSLIYITFPTSVSNIVSLPHSLFVPYIYYYYS